MLLAVQLRINQEPTFMTYYRVNPTFISVNIIGYYNGFLGDPRKAFITTPLINVSSKSMFTIIKEVKEGISRRYVSLFGIRLIPIGTCSCTALSQIL